MKGGIKEWLDSLGYLPEEMKDFHDQKIIFKMIEDAASKDLGKGSIERPDWVSAHCYVIDEFLWFMAQHGYILQRCRKKLPFRSLEESALQYENARANEFARIIADSKGQ